MDGDSTGDEEFMLPVVKEVDDTSVWGFGIGHNLNNHLNLNADIWFGSTGIEVGVFKILEIPSLEVDTDLIGMDFNLDYNILKSRFTPMVTGGIGFIYYDGEFINSRIFFKESDFSETDFSYNFGFGARWDIGDNFLVKALYRLTWSKLGGTDDRLKLDGISISIAYVF